MPVIRFNNWESEGRTSLFRGQRLVTEAVGAKSLTTGLTRFQPGARIRLHYHDCEEQVTIVEGKGVAIIDGERVELNTFDTTYVAAGVPHHFMNESDKPMAILYIYPSNKPGRHELEPDSMATATVPIKGS